MSNAETRGSGDACAASGIRASVLNVSAVSLPARR